MDKYDYFEVGIRDAAEGIDKFTMIRKKVLYIEEYGDQAGAEYEAGYYMMRGDIQKEGINTPEDLPDNYNDPFKKYR